jgi:hypothetical protein
MIQKKALWTKTRVIEEYNTSLQDICKESALTKLHKMPSRVLFFSHTEAEWERERRKTEKSRKRSHLCINLHITLALQDLDLLTAPGPVSFEINLELGRSNTEHLHQCRLS